MSAAARLPRLKWHRLRRRAGDAAFLHRNLKAGLAAGAALEIDTVLTRDGAFLCIHDQTLDRETTGRGAVRDATRAEIQRLRQRGNDGEPLDEPPLFLDEVVATVRGAASSTGGLVQIDFKEPGARLSDAEVARFATLLGDAAPRFIVSGGEWDPVQRLVGATPGLHFGFDPLGLYRAGLPTDAAGYRAIAETTLRTAPGAAIYYLEARLVLAALEHGVDLVALVKRDSAEVDAWTLDPTTPGIVASLRTLSSLGCDQITTNDPETIETILKDLHSC